MTIPSWTYEAKRNYNLKKKYGIDLEIYKNMLLEQKGVCKICGLPETAIIRGRIAALAVDHCHETGKVRGLLCMNCNRMLGNAKDSTANLLNAIKYLEDHQ